MQKGFSVMSTALSQSVDSALRDYITFWATRDWINFSPEDGTLICPVYFVFLCLYQTNVLRNNYGRCIFPLEITFSEKTMLQWQVDVNIFAGRWNF